MSLLEEVEGKVIIWANYRHDIRKINKALSEKYGSDSVGMYFGDVQQSEREGIIRDFQNPDSKMRFFVGNTQTGGYGITLTAANTVIYYSNVDNFLDPSIYNHDIHNSQVEIKFIIFYRIDKIFIKKIVKLY